MKTLIVWIFVVCTSTASFAQSTDGAQQIQSLLSNPKNSAALGQAMAVGSILTCTQKQVGKEATTKFYQDMNEVGKTISSYCKEGHATEARATLLATLKTNQNDPVYRAALACYDTQAANIRMMAGTKFSANIDKYVVWAKDVPAAEQNMKESDVCKPKAN